jgi:hypothetical protein
MKLDPCAHLAGMIAKFGRVPKAHFAMFWAYFDETVVNIVDTSDGKHRPTQMLVGGCIAPALQWEKFSVKWKKALAKAGVSEFHAKDFYSFQREFKWLTAKGGRDFKRHNKFGAKLADIIVEFVDELIVFTSQVSVSAKGVKQSYEDAALRALYDMTKGHANGRDSLYVVLARHPELAPWTILRKFEMIDWEKKLAGCGVFYPDDVVPLQAADFVLHSVNQRWKGVKTVSFNRLVEGCKARGKTFHQQIGSSYDPQAALAEQRG